MKKIIFFMSLIIMSMSASTVFASDSKSSMDKATVPNKTENKLSEEEIARLTKRVEEIRSMDKTKLTITEKRELRKELREIKKTVRRDGQYVYIGTGTLILLIILVIVLV